MFAILHALGRFAADLFKSRCRLEAENFLLRHQLTEPLLKAAIGLRLLTAAVRLRGSAASASFQGILAAIGIAHAAPMSVRSDIPFS